MAITNAQRLLKTDIAVIAGLVGIRTSLTLTTSGTNDDRPAYVLVAYCDCTAIGCTSMWFDSMTGFVLIIFCAVYTLAIRRVLDG